MAYIPPTYDDISADLGSGYIAPVYNEVNADLFFDFGATIPVLSYFQQMYDLPRPQAESYFQQLYTLIDPTLYAPFRQLYSAPLASYFVQRYGIEFVSSFTQMYKVAALVESKYSQPYRSANVINIFFRQKYKSADLLISSYQSLYNIAFDALSYFREKYNVAGTLVESNYHQLWDLNEKVSVISYFAAPYILRPDSIDDSVGGVIDVPVVICGGSPVVISVSADVPVIVNGKEISYSNLSLRWGHSSYAGSINFTMTKKSEWLAIKRFDPVIFIYDGVTFNAIVLSTPDDEDFTSSTLKVEAMSSSVLLDLPYAAELENDDLVYGAASEIVERIANLEGFSIVWDIPADPPLTSNAYQVAGSSPLEAVKGIVNGLGCILQTYPDGTIHAQRKHPYDTDKYASSTISDVLYQGLDFVSVSNDLDETPGYNRYDVTADSITEGYRLEQENITANHYLIKAFRVPWKTENVILETSETTNVRIVPDFPFNPATEVITETIEIIGGAGVSTTSHPCYGVTTHTYNDAIDLGAPTIDESGNITTAVAGNSLLEVSYTTKYWNWNVYDTDNEQVQFILIKR